MNNITTRHFIWDQQNLYHPAHFFWILGGRGKGVSLAQVHPGSHDLALWGMAPLCCYYQTPVPKTPQSKLQMLALLAPGHFIGLLGLMIYAATVSPAGKPFYTNF